MQQTSIRAAILEAIVLLCLNVETVSAEISAVQAMIDRAAVGDTVLVPAGTHEGNIVLNKRLTLLGKDNPVLRGDGTASTVTIRADSCVLKGFVIEHCGKDLMLDHSGIVIRSRGNVIENNSLRDILFGIYLNQGHYNQIVKNEIRGRAELGLGERGSGIHIFDSYYNTLTDNTITDVRDGFYIEYANNTFIARNTVYNIRYGLHYMYADTNVFLQNCFYNNVAGAAIMYSKNIRFRHNVFAHNRGFASYGILFQDCHAMLADSNVIADNVVGMFFEASTDNEFRHNILAQNDVGLKMFQNSTNNTFRENNFVDNLNPLTLVGKQTQSRWSENGKGNFWSSYDGYDLDVDGIGDVPMKIQNVFHYLEGRNENVRLYLYSPASQALTVAAKAFPIIAISNEADNQPLTRPLNMNDFPAVRMLSHLERSTSTGAKNNAFIWFVVPWGSLIAIGFVYHRLSRRET